MHKLQCDDLIPVLEVKVTKFCWAELVKKNKQNVINSLKSASLTDLHTKVDIAPSRKDVDKWDKVRNVSLIKNHFEKY